MAPSGGERPAAGCGESAPRRPLRLRRSSCPAWLVMVEQGRRVPHAADRHPGRVHRRGREELGESAAVDPDVPPVGDHGPPVCPGGGRSGFAERVMHPAQGHDVVPVCRTALLPRPHVMQVAMAHRRRTSRERAATVAQTDRSSKARRGQPHSQSHVQDLGVAAEYGRDELSAARQHAQLSGGQGCAVGEQAAGGGPVEKVLVGDQHLELRRTRRDRRGPRLTTLRGLRSAEDLDQCVAARCCGVSCSANRSRVSFADR